MQRPNSRRLQREQQPADGSELAPRTRPDAPDVTPRPGSIRGQSVVEFALVLPVMMLLLVIGVDFGRLFFTSIQLTNAAREGANYAATNPTDTATIQSRVLAEANVQAQRGEGAITVATVCADSAGTTILCSAAKSGTAASGNTIRVSAREAFSFMTPLISGFFGGSLQVGAATSAVVLGYAPGAGGSNPGSCAGPVASFTMIISDETVTVNPSASTPNSGVCNISGYNWDWGDGSSDVGSATGATHTYASKVNYTIILTVTNQGGADFDLKIAYLGGGGPGPCVKPVASFTWTKGSGSASKDYSFTDTSTVADSVNCPITSWLWEFGDNTYDNSGNARNPIHSYSDNSQHTVVLKVTNAGGTATYSSKQ